MGTVQRQRQGPNGRNLDWRDKELIRAEQDFHDLRKSGYTEWIDQDGRRAHCPMCEKPGCPRLGVRGAVHIVSRREIDLTGSELHRRRRSLAAK